MKSQRTDNCLALNQTSRDSDVTTGVGPSVEEIDQQLERVQEQYLPVGETNGHINENQLEAYILGTLGPEAIREVELHLLLCKECQQEYDRQMQRIEHLRRALKHLRDDPEPPTN